MTQTQMEDLAPAATYNAMGTHTNTAVCITHMPTNAPFSVTITLRLSSANSN